MFKRFLWIWLSSCVFFPSVLFGQEVDTSRVIVLLEDPSETGESSVMAMMNDDEASNTLQMLANLEGATFPKLMTAAALEPYVLPTVGAAIVPIQAGRHDDVVAQLRAQNAEFVLSYVRELPDFRKSTEPAGVLVQAADTSKHPLLTWGVDQIGADEVWDEFNITGSGQKVALIDSGFFRSARNAPHFSSSNITLLTENDFFGPKRSLEDVPTSNRQGGHGTHVAGTIVGQKGLGVAPGAELVVMKVFGVLPGNSRVTTTDAIVFAAVNAAILARVDVINMSLGAPANPGSKRLWDKALRRAEDENILVFAATGNDRTGSGNTPAVPAASDFAIPIGATDDQDLRATFSQGFTGLTHGFMAPGVGVKSAGENSDLRVLQGTSMATPHAAGAALLTRQAEKKSLNREALADIWRKSAHSVAGGFAAVGHGRIDVYKAVKSLVKKDEEEKPPNDRFHNDAIKRMDRVIASQEVNIADLKKLRDSLGNAVPGKPPGSGRSLVKDPVDAPIHDDEGHAADGRKASRIEVLYLLDRYEEKLDAAKMIEHQKKVAKAAADIALKKMDANHKKAIAVRKKAAADLKRAEDEAESALAAWEKTPTIGPVGTRLKAALDMLQTTKDDLHEKDKAAMMAEEQRKKAADHLEGANVVLRDAQNRVNDLKAKVEELEGATD